MGKDVFGSGRLVWGLEGKATQGDTDRPELGDGSASAEMMGRFCTNLLEEFITRTRGCGGGGGHVD